MRLTRIYHPLETAGQNEIALSKSASHHLMTVLRLPLGAQLELFDGRGHRSAATITFLEKKEVRVQLNAWQPSTTRSPLAVHLGQVISRGERMDYTIQKAVELGVASITPLFSERCTVKLSGDRLEKKMAHWQGVIISACEQCGQDTLPQLFSAMNLQNWLPTVTEPTRLTLIPGSTTQFSDLPNELHQVALLVGAEGGLTELEIKQAQQFKFQGVQLGPRILRTETAALTALSILQFRFGDL